MARNLEDMITWETTQAPGSPTNINASINVGTTTLVRQGETEVEARARLVMLLREGLLELVTGIKLQSPSGLQ